MLDLNNFNDFIPNEAQESSNLESNIYGIQVTTLSSHTRHQMFMKPMARK